MTNVETDRCQNCGIHCRLDELFPTRERGVLYCWPCACQTGEGISREHERLLGDLDPDYRLASRLSNDANAIRRARAR